MKLQPTVSVVMATYNGERFLREQMDSILAQTYPIMEIIVQDDCSTDSTVGIVRKYMERNENIRLFVNKHNIGFNLNFQTATMRAKGDFIAFSDQDDMWFPDKIERLVESIGSHSICFCDVLRGKDMANSVKVSYKPYLESLLFRSLLGHTMLLRRDFASRCKHWENSWTYDWNLALMAHIEGNGIAKCPPPLVWHRDHDAEFSNNKLAVRRKPSKWRPYLCGWNDYRYIQKTERWKSFYTLLLAKEGLKRHPLAYRLVNLLLSRKLSDLLRLCFLCMAHKDIIYPSNAKGLKGCLRGFFFPSIYAYYNKGEFV